MSEPARPPIPTTSHWGAFSARPEPGGGIEVIAHPDDPAPSPLLGNVPGGLRHATRVARPAIRRGWLDDGPGPSASFPLQLADARRQLGPLGSLGNRQSEVTQGNRPAGARPEGRGHRSRRRARFRLRMALSELRSCSSGPGVARFALTRTSAHLRALRVLCLETQRVGVYRYLSWTPVDSGELRRPAERRGRLSYQLRTTPPVGNRSWRRAVVSGCQ
jgi:Molybdopterin oxidoreductase N-terminal domain